MPEVKSENVKTLLLAVNRFCVDVELNHAVVGSNLRSLGGHTDSIKIFQERLFQMLSFNEMQDFEKVNKKLVK